MKRYTQSVSTRAGCPSHREQMAYAAMALCEGIEAMRGDDSCAASALLSMEHVVRMANAIEHYARADAARGGAV